MPSLHSINALINKALERIPEDAEYEDYGEGSMRYALVAFIEQTLKEEIPNWLLEIAEV
jgi:hypothetical protein